MTKDRDDDQEERRVAKDLDDDQEERRAANILALTGREESKKKKKTKPKKTSKTKKSVVESSKKKNRKGRNRNNNDQNSSNNNIPEPDNTDIPTSGRKGNKNNTRNIPSASADRETLQPGAFHVAPFNLRQDDNSSSSEEEEDYDDEQQQEQSQNNNNRLPVAHIERVPPGQRAGYIENHAPNERTTQGRKQRKKKEDNDLCFWLIAGSVFCVIVLAAIIVIVVLLAGGGGGGGGDDTSTPDSTNKPEWVEFSHLHLYSVMLGYDQSECSTAFEPPTVIFTCYGGTTIGIMEAKYYAGNGEEQTNGYSCQTVPDERNNLNTTKLCTSISEFKQQVATGVWIVGCATNDPSEGRMVATAEYNPTSGCKPAPQANQSDITQSLSMGHFCFPEPPEIPSFRPSVNCLNGLNNTLLPSNDLDFCGQSGFCDSPDGLACSIDNVNPVVVDTELDASCAIFKPEAHSELSFFDVLSTDSLWGTLGSSSFIVQTFASDADDVLSLS